MILLNPELEIDPSHSMGGYFVTRKRSARALAAAGLGVVLPNDLSVRIPVWYDWVKARLCARIEP